MYCSLHVAVNMCEHTVSQLIFITSECQFGVFFYFGAICTVPDFPC